jgi:hypothetical protein
MKVVRGMRLSPKLLPSMAALALSAAGLVHAQHSAVVDLPDSIAAAGSEVTWVKKIPFYCEGPAVDLSDGTFYFTEQHDNSDMNWPIWKIGNPGNPSDTGSRWITASNQSNGLFVDGKGRVIAAQKGKFVRYNKNGTVESTLATSGNGANFGQANDFSMGADGSSTSPISAARSSTWTRPASSRWRPRDSTAPTASNGSRRSMPSTSRRAATCATKWPRTDP